MHARQASITFYNEAGEMTLAADGTFRCLTLAMGVKDNVQQCDK